MFEFINNAWAASSPFALAPVYHLGQTPGIEKTLRHFGHKSVAIADNLADRGDL
jgi:hypothetical protein